VSDHHCPPLYTPSARSLHVCKIHPIRKWVSGRVRAELGPFRTGVSNGMRLDTHLQRSVMLERAVDTSSIEPYFHPRVSIWSMVAAAVRRLHSPRLTASCPLGTAATYFHPCATQPVERC
jgi:hypothetical protein